MAIRKQPLSKIPYSFKINVFGDEGVGKTSIIQKYVGGQLENVQATSQTEISCKELLIGDEDIKLMIIDNPSTKKCLSSSMALTDTSAVIVVYDVTKINSLEGAKEWVKSIMNTDDGKNVCFVLVGNKIDLKAERIVPATSIEEYVCSFGGKHYTTSALTGTNIDTLFWYLTLWLRQIKERGKPHHDFLYPSESVILQENARSPGPAIGSNCCADYMSHFFCGFCCGPPSAEHEYDDVDCCYYDCDCLN